MISSLVRTVKNFIGKQPLHEEAEPAKPDSDTTTDSPQMIAASRITPTMRLAALSRRVKYVFWFEVTSAS